jgi:hypothetical protein
VEFISFHIFLKKKGTIHNYLKYVPNKKRKHPTINYDNILLSVATDNIILELQGFLKHNDFIGKPTTIIK